MGFTPNRKLYRLKFEGELEGLEVVARSSSVLVYEEIAELADREVSSPPTAADRKAMANLRKAFADVLVEWNLEEPAGVPVPATLRGLKTQEPALVNAVVAGWMDAVATALGATQAVEALEASLPMEPLDA